MGNLEQIRKMQMFQQDAGLQPADGIVGQRTWGVLCEIMRSVAAAPIQQPPIQQPPIQQPPIQQPPQRANYIKCTTPNADPASLKAFIGNPGASTLDFLPNSQCLEYRNLKWNYYDYPGGQGRPLLDKNGKPVADKFGNTKEPAGPNEKKARQMIEALKIVNPERRATVEAGRVPVGTAVLCVLCNRDDPHIIIENIGTTPKRTISSELWSWIKGQLVSVQDIGKEYAEKRLNKYAAESFERMREDAKKDGINLVILAGGGAAFREKAASDTGCLAAQNTFAVACFPNSHNLGLAVDLWMSYGNQRYQEATTLGTYGMQNVVDMRQSLVHKWLFLNAAKYNWYPYTHEPWHWEYNPPNFANAFFAGAPK